MLKRDRSPRKQSPSGRRARSRHALFTDENYFNAIFAHANVGATRLDRQGRFVAVNDRFCEITGYSREELLSGMTPLDLSHPDDRERDRELLMPFVEGRKTSYGVEKRYVRKDGEVIWVKITGGILRDGQGRARHAVGIVEDITATYKAQMELAALRDRLAADLSSMIRLHQISTRFLDESNLTALLEESLETAIDITGADMGKIQLFDPGSRALKIMIHRGFEQPFLDAFAVIERGRGGSGEAAMRGERVVIEDIATSSIFVGTPELDVMLQAGVKAMQSTPLLARSGQLVGTLSTHYRKPYCPGETQLRLLDVLCRQITDLIDGKLAHDALRESERRLRDVMDHANACVWIKDLGGRFTMVNAYMAKVLRLSKDEIIGRTVFDLFPPSEARQFDATDRQVLESGKPMEFEEVQTHGGVPHTYLVMKFPLRNGDGAIYALCAICSDVTERKAVERELWRNRRDLARAQAVAQTGSWRLDMRRDELVWSDETYRIFGVPLGAALSYETFLAAVHPEDRDFVDKSWKAALQGGRYDLDHRIVVGNETKWIRERAELEFDQNGNPIGGFGTCQDITERKKIEEELRELTRTLEARVAERTAELEQRASQLFRLNQELSRVEQRERRRLAELLHDGLQQTLVAAKFRVAEARRAIKENDPLQNSLNCIDELLTQSIATSRSLTSELAPPVLTELGLVPALGWLAESMEAQHALKVEVRAAENLGASSSLELRLALFQSVRELLFNVVKHAGVQCALVVVDRKGDDLLLKVIDHGRGFDVSKWQAAGEPGCGFGLLNVRNRLELIGGTLEVISAPAQGTQVTINVRVPLD